MAATLLVPTLLYDGTRAPPRADAAVLVDSGRILEVGPAAELRTRTAEVVALQGTLCPGLIDVHTHLALAATADPAATLRAESGTRTTARAIRHLAQQLLAGVTTVRDLGAPGGIDLELARAQREGFLRGPRVMPAGKLVAMTGGHACYLGVEADGPDAVRRAVREQLKAGAEVIKVIATGGIISEGVQPGSPQLTVEEMRAAVEEAVKAGRRVSAHAQGTAGIHNALQAGVHTVEHGFWLDDAAVGLMRQKDVTFVATFCAARAMLEQLERLPAFIRAKMETVGDAHARSFRRVLEGGVRFACGTDAGTPFNPHGSLPREVALHVEHGAPVLAALHAATGAAAEALGRDDVGLLARGRIADLVLVDGDPAQDVSALTRVRATWQAGRVVDRAALAAISANVAA
ncbi:MAG: amidohydrolase family protein [Deltaproteobacteria bacterium]|nr:amidohydrolase family protein [Deltaproteobacteria bacterium]